MKTHNDITVRLLDGKSQIASWTRNFEKLPTIGDTLPVEVPDLAGYKPEAMVSKIEVELSGNETVVILDAVPQNGSRPLVILNENFIPEPLRHEVEEHLRSRLDVPAFEWVANNEARPVVDIHAATGATRDKIARLNEEIRAILAEASKLTTV